MYKVIAVPVDLAHVDRLTKALETAADLAKAYGATLYYVGATTETPSSVAHTPKEFKGKLEQFAAERGTALGIDARARSLVSLDPAVDLDRDLLKTFKEIDADLVVMASHIPGIKEHLISSNAGWIASHAKISVFVVR
ncbi:MAG: universal stress protein [Geminicoccaceae bacterium]|nr:universal stress protein [Geminicoccaceae bacterium]MCB9967074.1 universal stress protein [Geminicoccaceae bacterium]HRY24916.1 universal stress protein [Geminicoccaceae bacterium]